MQSLFKTSVAVASFTAVSVTTGENAERAVTDAVDANTLKGKFLFGYPGFFRWPGQSNDHWTIKGLTPDPSTPGDGEISLSPLGSAILATFHGALLRYRTSNPADISKSSLTCSQRWSIIPKSASLPLISSSQTVQMPLFSNLTVLAL